MRTEVTVRVNDVLAKLQPLAKSHKVERLSDLSKIIPDFGIEAGVDEKAVAAEAGYVDADDHYAEVIEELSSNVNDLRDGRRALIDGDREMAATLLLRAFSEWDDAKRAVEDVLLSRTVHDRLQPLLLVA